MDADAEDQQKIIDGLAVYAVTFAGMGYTDSEAREALLGVLTRVRQSDPAIVRAAAVRVGYLPMPEDETVEELERAQPVRDVLGLPTPADELADALRAREWLEKLAEDLESGRN